MESDHTVFYTFKYLPFVFALFFIGIPLLGHLSPESSTFNGEPGPPDTWTTITLISIGTLAALIPFLYLDKLVVVQMDHQHLRILKGGNTTEISWTDVKSVDIVPAAFPPLYKLKLKKNDSYYLFNTTRNGANFIVFTWDWSDMGEMIKQKKKELGI